MKILILCTGNSCRSQMAEGFMRSFDNRLEVYSAGTEPAEKVHPKAIRVMDEEGIDISAHRTKSVDEFLDKHFDYSITVCDDVKEKCPYFNGKADRRVHICFEDPARAEGTEEEVLAVFRKVRDEIRKEFYEFYQEKIKH